MLRLVRELGGWREVRPPAAARRGGAPPRAAPQQGARRGRRQPPLRRVERLLPAGARAQPDLLVRGVPRLRRHARAGAGQQVRADLPQAGPAAGHAAARRRLRLGRHGHARRPAPRRAGGRRHDLAAAGRAGREAGGRGGAVGPGRDPRAGLPRGRRRSLRRRQLDRHVRARRARRAWPSTSSACGALLRRRAGCSTTASAARPAPRRRVCRAAASSTATCSPTASCTRSAV